MPSTRINVGVFVYNQVEELDFVGPFETFQVAGHQARDLRGLKEPAVTVFTVAESESAITTSGGLVVTPHHTFEDHPRIDVLVAPGGDASGQSRNPVAVDWLARVAKGTTIATSVCTGAFLLAKVGLLDGARATTHWMLLDEFAAAYPHTTVVRDVRWVDEGSVVTSAGISAGIDMSLHVVERLLGDDVARATARYLEFPWTGTPSL